MDVIAHDMGYMISLVNIIHSAQIKIVRWRLLGFQTLERDRNMKRYLSYRIKCFNADITISRMCYKYLWL